MPSRSRWSRVVHGDNEIEQGHLLEPGKRARVLVQHHAHARLALTIAPVRAAPLGATDQARRLQLQLGPGVAPLEPVLPPHIFVEVLHVPTRMAGPVLAKHPDDPVDRHPPHRRPAKAAIRKSGIPVLLIAAPPTPELAPCGLEREAFPRICAAATRVRVGLHLDQAAIAVGGPGRSRQAARPAPAQA
jgi:hypothetical protein